MANVHKRTWMTKTLGARSTWTADYFAPGPDGKRKRHTKSNERSDVQFEKLPVSDRR